MRLSPLLAAMIAATASIGLSKPTRGETVQSLPDAPQQDSSGVKTPLQAVPETIAVQAKPTTTSVIHSSENQVAVPTKSVVQSVPTTLSVNDSSATQVAVPTQLVVPVDASPTQVAVPTQLVVPVDASPTQLAVPTQLVVPVDPSPAELPSQSPKPPQLSPDSIEGIAQLTPPNGIEQPSQLPEPTQLEPPSSQPPLSPDSIEGITQLTPPNGIDQLSQLPEPTQLEPPSSQPPSDSSEVRVLVAEVLITGAPAQLEDEIYRVIKTRPGRATTRSQLQEDVNAIFATGFFSSVDVQPEDTPLGVRITFIVRANPVLRQVAVKTEPPGEGQRIVNQEKINEIFGEQYGSILNLRDLQEGIKQLNDWYKEEGYDLAQVIDAEQVSPDGTVTLVVAEGVIEAVKVRFLDEDGNPIVDENGNPIPPMTDQEEPVGGNTRPFIITREVELKSGTVFNRKKAQRDLQRVFGLGIFDDVRFSFEPGTDPRQVVIVVDVIEKSSGSIA
ncbi:MAG: hypothetical protein F6K56_39555, partial [Moorea sp. SIO3G5]|nr:hypothetical protein [Moorena sp. SIO3G5]